MSALNIISNIGMIGAKLIQSFLSFAGAIVTGGLTAPLAAVSIASTASSIYDFVQNPSGDINQSIKGAVQWVGESIGHPNATAHIFNKANQLGAGVDPLGISPIPNVSIDTLNKQAETYNIYNARTKGINDMTEPYSILSLTDPAIRMARANSNNSHDFARIQVIRNSINSEGIKSV